MVENKFNFNAVFSSLNTLNKYIESNKRANPAALGFVAYHLVFSGDDLVRAIWQILTSKSNWSDTNPYYDEFNQAQLRFDNADKQTWHVDFLEDDVEQKAHAWYLPQSTKTNKTAILLHGFRGPARFMGPWADLLFYQEGYNVLTPTLRGTWESGGKHLALGWNERNDIISWVNRIIEVEGNDSQIVIYGISGGAATTMMSTGLELPANVKAIVEDCGYTSAGHQLKSLLNTYLPAIFEGLSDKEISLIMLTIYALMYGKQGLDLYDVSSVACLKKNNIPAFFIQSGEDKIVPKEMAEELFIANAGEKDIYYIDGIGHVEGILQQLPEYKKNLNDFLSKYITP